MHKQTLTVIIKSDCNGSRNDKNNSKPWQTKRTYL